MSKTAEERIAELQEQMESIKSENSKLQNHYGQAYRAMEEAKQGESFLRGKLEAAQANRSNPHEMAQTAYDEFSSSPEVSSIESILNKLVSEKLEPRMKMVEKYATDALQQTAGREVDRALKSFKDKHPESSRIMDFERLIMLDAADEVKRRQAVNQPVGDVKEIALSIAQERISKFNKLESRVAEENKKRREHADKKAMLPDMFSAAGFEEHPGAPSNAKEAGDLLEDLVRRQKANH
tara:strand:+ start:288 stop:1001 length:714 start_codon:yes stop_codon:yes gene_type:complete